MAWLYYKIFNCLSYYYYTKIIFDLFINIVIIYRKIKTISINVHIIIYKKIYYKHDLKCLD
ncbi:hypothetical protein Clo1100_1504 [Clostridium sp. BNL1100]|nr:hypothetical protein Clo1100_1504 [Clostridium sp. BNL1100]